MGKPLAYYNEHDPFAAAWLRELIAEKLIAPGEVDERSIEDVLPNELAGFAQCHFFAGIGVWSLALRQAGWPDDKPVWTGSCPCQPFSAAGKGAGFDDERHLWPVFHWLIAQCRPASVLGEQVASGHANAWIDLVQADVEALGYAFGCVPFPAAGVGAPHIRDRAYWVADATHDHGWCGERGTQAGAWPDGERRRGLAGGGATLRLADGNGGLASDRQLQRGGQHGQQPQDGGAVRSGDCGPRIGAVTRLERTGPVNGYWRSADWLYCRDGKWRPVEPETFPLVDAGAVRNRVGQLRGAGNAVTLAQAQAFIEAVIEARSLSLERAA